MFLFDTIGIGLFTILGLQKTLDIGLSPVIAVMMGTVSAVIEATGLCGDWVWSELGEEGVGRSCERSERRRG